MLGHSIVSQHFMEPEGSIPNSQELSICSYPEPDQSSPHISKESVQVRGLCKLFVTGFFLWWGVVNPTPNPPKLEDRPLFSVRDCLFSIFAANLHIWRPFLHPQPGGAPCCGGRDPRSNTTKRSSVQTVQCNLAASHYVRVQNETHPKIVLGKQAETIENSPMSDGSCMHCVRTLLVPS
jgi:hypothetical protein